MEHLEMQSSPLQGLATASCDVSCHCTRVTDLNTASNSKFTRIKHTSTCICTSPKVLFYVNLLGIPTCRILLCGKPIREVQVAMSSFEASRSKNTAACFSVLFGFKPIGNCNSHCGFLSLAFFRFFGLALSFDSFFLPVYLSSFRYFCMSFFPAVRD